MSWISDVEAELKALEFSKKKLRNFGLLVGGILLLISVWIFFSQRNELPETSNYTFAYIFLVLGGFLFLFGAFVPLLLKTTYKIWMGLAIAMGWFISRILIMILFYTIVTPIALIAKLFKKDFLDLKFRDDKNSYWIVKPKDVKIDYKKMY
jgi:hypothetical protein